MLWCDLRRSILSRRMAFTILFGLVCLYLPTFYLLIEEKRWIWENNLVDSLRDAYGLGIYIFCAPATAAICASSLYIQDRKAGVFTMLLQRIGKRRYMISKVMCCGLAGSCALVVPVLLFSFFQYSIYAGFKCVPGEWSVILSDCISLVPFGFVWAVVGLSLSSWADSVQVAYASPYAIAMLMKIIGSVTGLGWLDPMRQISPINTVLIDTWMIVSLQGTLFIASLTVLRIGVKKCAN